MNGVVPEATKRRSLAFAVAGAVVATAFALGAGFTIKDRCTTHAWDGFQYRSSCYNDIFALYSFRGLHEEPFPYVHGDGKLSDNDGQSEAGDLEYPVGTGYLVGVVALVVDNGQAFFRTTAIILAALALAGAALLVRMAHDRRRVLFFALGPSLVLYAFHNWDLLAVALLCAGLFAFRRGSDGWTGVFIGLGAASKVFPGLILPALVLSRVKDVGAGPWRARVPWKMIGWAAISFVAVNLPILLIAPKGWALPWVFQSTRFPNFETWGYMLYRHGATVWPTGFWSETYPAFTSYASAAMFAAGATLLLLREWRHEGPSRPYATSMQLMMLFLLTAKVYSPQFALWVLPFFVLVEISWIGYGWFAVTDAAVWFAISKFFIAYQIGGGSGDPELVVLEFWVYVRYAVLAGLILVAGRARENVAGYTAVRA